MELLPCIEALRWVFNHAPWDDVTRVLILLEYLHVNSRLLVKVGDHRTAMPSLQAARIARGPCALREC